MTQASKVLINLVGVSVPLHPYAVFKALQNLWHITFQDLVERVLHNKFAQVELVLAHEGVSQETTIGGFFEGHPEFLEAGEPQNITFGRYANKMYDNETELRLLFQVFRNKFLSSDDFPASHKGEEYWVFLREANAITVTVTDIAKEWRRLTRLVYEPTRLS